MKQLDEFGDPEQSQGRRELRILCELDELEKLYELGKLDADDKEVIVVISVRMSMEG